MRKKEKEEEGVIDEPESFEYSIFHSPKEGWGWYYGIFGQIFRIYSSKNNLPKPILRYRSRASLVILAIFRKKVAEKCNKIQFWEKFWIHEKIFRIPLVNRPKNGFLWGQFFKKVPKNRVKKTHFSIFA